MSIWVWLSFLTVSLLAAFSPGPAVLLAISNSTTRGPRKALLSSSGNAAGIFMVSSAAMIGLGALIKTSLLLFSLLKIAGAAYLVYLGVKQWRSANQRRSMPIDSPAATDKTSLDLFREGLLVALTNPKSIIFFTALFPQFIQTRQPVLPQFFVLTLTFVGCALLSHLTFVMVARSAKSRFTSGTNMGLIQRVGGALFVSLGLALLAAKKT